MGVSRRQCAQSLQSAKARSDVEYYSISQYRIIRERNDIIIGKQNVTSVFCFINICIMYMVCYNTFAEAVPPLMSFTFADHTILVCYSIHRAILLQQILPCMAQIIKNLIILYYELSLIVFLHVFKKSVVSMVFIFYIICIITYYKIKEYFKRHIPSDLLCRTTLILCISYFLILHYISVLLKLHLNFKSQSKPNSYHPLIFQRQICILYY